MVRDDRGISKSTKLYFFSFLFCSIPPFDHNTTNHKEILPSLNLIKNTKNISKDTSREFKVVILLISIWMGLCFGFRGGTDEQGHMSLGMTPRNSP